MILNHARPRIGAAALEFKLHCAIAATLRDHCLPTWRFTHLPLGEARSPATAGKLKAMGVTPGWPDFMLIGPRKICFLELKRVGRGMSEAQHDIAQFLMAGGCGFGMTDNYYDAITMLKDWGALPAGFNPQ